MATDMALGDIVKHTIVATTAGQTTMNVFHYVVSVIGGTPATDQDACSAFNTAVAAAFKAQVSPDTTYKGIMTNIIARAVNPIGVQDISSAGVGGTGAHCGPKQACGLTSWYTAAAGRKFRGRTYWPMLPDGTYTAGGELSAAEKALIDTTANAVQTYGAIATGGRSATLKLVIFHRASNTYTTVAVRLTRSTIATQKRRGDFGKLNPSPI